MDLAAIDSDIARERASLTGTMERLKAELKATEEKLSGMEQRRQEKADVVQSKYETAAAKLEKDMGVAAILWAGMLPFLPWDVVKIAATVVLAGVLVPRMKELK